jgi:hypothetical protein
MLSAFLTEARSTRTARNGSRGAGDNFSRQLLFLLPFILPLILLAIRRIWLAGRLRLRRDKIV